MAVCGQCARYIPSNAHPVNGNKPVRLHGDIACIALVLPDDGYYLIPILGTEFSGKATLAIHERSGNAEVGYCLTNCIRRPFSDENDDTRRKPSEPATKVLIDTIGDERPVGCAISFCSATDEVAVCDVS